MQSRIEDMWSVRYRAESRRQVGIVARRVTGRGGTARPPTGWADREGRGPLVIYALAALALWEGDDRGVLDRRDFDEQRPRPRSSATNKVTSLAHLKGTGDRKEKGASNRRESSP